MKIFLNHPVSVKEGWLSTLQLSKKAFPKVWYLVIGTALLTMLAYIPPMLITSNMVIAGVLLFILSFLINSYLGAFVTYKTYAISTEQTISLRTLITLVNKRYIKFTLSLIFTSMLPFFVGFLLGYVVGFTIGKYFGHLLAINIYSNELWKLYLLVTIISLPIALLIGFIFVFLSVASPLVLLDNQGVWSAIRANQKLVRGHWWHSYIMITPLTILFIIGSQLLNVLSTQYTWLNYGINLVFIAMFYFIFSALSLVLLNDLKLRNQQNN